MEEKRQATYDRIELRSPKVRKILGETPFKLERWGMIIIGIILVALTIVMVKVDYPYGRGESILEHIFSLIG